jgi:hypothetical protein
MSEQDNSVRAEGREADESGLLLSVEPIGEKYLAKPGDDSDDGGILSDSDSSDSDSTDDSDMGDGSDGDGSDGTDGDSSDDGGILSDSDSSDSDSDGGDATTV